MVFYLYFGGHFDFCLFEGEEHRIENIIRCSRFSEPPFQHTGGLGPTMKLVSSYRGVTCKLVSTYPRGTLKLENNVSFKLPPLVSDHPAGVR